MKIQIQDHCVIVTREKSDPVFSGIVNAAGESRLLYHIKNILNKQGYDLIKKRMWRDGHLMDEMQQYLRTRKKTGDPKRDIYIWNTNWNVEGAEVDFNTRGETKLAIEYDVFNPKV
jgi:hypothetical protein